MGLGPIKVMLVDDNPADIDLTREFLQLGKPRLAVVTAADGQHAVDELERTLRNREPLPDLILLDLNMPRLDGRGFLTKLRARDEFRALPVVILTSSDADQDIVRSYKLGANCYVKKPVGLEEFQKVVNTIECCWLTVVKLP